MDIKKRKRVKAEPRIQGSKFKKEDCCVEVREELRQVLGSREGLPDAWATTAEVVRETTRMVIVSS